MLEESVELLLRSLLSAERHHHRDVHLAEAALFETCRGATLGQNHLVDEKRRPGIAPLQGGDHAPQDLDTIAVIVVVQALSQEEDVAALFWLGCEEVVLLEGQSAFEVLDGCVLGLIEHMIGDVLHDEPQGGELLYGVRIASRRVER